MEIDIVFDPACPWCYIGKRRIERALALRPRMAVKPRWWPFLLNPEIPAAGLSRETYLVRKFGSEARVRRMLGAIAEAGQSVEIDFAFDRISNTPNTVDAHRLVRFADRHGRAGAAVESLYLNYFVNGKDIGDEAVLVGIGTHLGLDTGALAAYLDSEDDVALIYEENARAHRLGINGVPSYVFNGTMVLSGAHDPQVLARMLDAAEVTAGAA